MERIKALNRYQKGILILLVVMLFVFTVLYAVLSARIGYEYGGRILVPKAENGGTVYSGTVRGEDAVIAVTSDRIVTVQYGSTVYGPYTLREDPTAVPADDEMAEYMTGIEILEGEEVFFRGGMVGSGKNRWVIAEDGSVDSVIITFTGSNGMEFDEDGNPYDEMRPTTGMILDLMEGPELTSKGEWIAWAMGAVLSAVTAASILFADELFYMSMSFRVMNAECAEPSEWVIAGRYISWTVLPVMVLVLYILGLQ